MKVNLRKVCIMMGMEESVSVRYCDAGDGANGLSPHEAEQLSLRDRSFIVDTFLLATETAMTKTKVKATTDSGAVGVEGGRKGKDARNHVMVKPHIPQLRTGAKMVAQVADATGVSVRTVHRHKRAALNGRCIRERGRPAVISQSIEDKFAEAISVATQQGEPLRRSQGMLILEKILSDVAGHPITLCKRTYGRLIKRLKKRGIAVRSGKSTSQARMEANTVAIMSGFFLGLKLLYAKYPLLLAQCRRIVVADESPLPYQGEKLGGSVDSVLIDSAHASGVARIGSMKNGSSRMTITAAVSADGYSWPNSYIVTGAFLQSKFTSSPLPHGLTQEYLNSLQIIPSESGVATKESFFLYLKKLIEHMRAQFKTGPLLILIDIPRVHGTVEELETIFGKMDPEDESNTGVLFYPFPANTTTKVREGGG